MRAHWVGSLSIAFAALGACGGRVSILNETGGAGAASIAGAASVAGASASPGTDGGASAAGAGVGGSSPGFGGGGMTTGTAGAAVASPCSRANEVSPDESVQWNWRRCGSAPPDPNPSHATGEKVGSVSLSADGKLLAASIDYATHVWLVAEPFSQSKHLYLLGNGSPWSELSRDGNRVLTMGEATAVYNSKDGQKVPFIDPLQENAQGVDSSQWCVGTEARFSPDGTLFAGKFYGTMLRVYDARTFALLAKRETYHCGQGIAFAGDGTLFTPEASFDARTLQPIAGDIDPTMSDPTRGGAEMRHLVVSCDGKLQARTACVNSACQTYVGNYAVSGGRHAALSPEEHWLVSGGTLLHLPTGRRIILDDTALAGTFALNGDVIIGERTGGFVTRYCRQ